MSDNARDTQFEGFAESLWADLVNLWWVSTDPPGVDNRSVAMVARRAYDLACHVLHFQAQDMALSFARDDPEWIQGSVAMIPDMTELPKEPL